MRAFEAGIGVALVIGAATVILGRSGLILATGFLSTVLLVLHVLIEGPRLQGLPAYLGVVILLAATFGQSHWILRTGMAILVFFCGSAGLLAFYFYPILKLPPPAGPYAIGTTIFYFTDHARREHYLRGGGESRRVVAQIWYPAKTCSGPAAPYRSPLDLISRFQRSHYVKTRACVDAPTVTPIRQWPVVFFSPSFGGYRSQTTYITEYLVSHGYIVVAVDHPGTGARIAFPDGFVAIGMPDAWLNLSSTTALRASQAKAEDVLDTNVKDLQFVLKQLQETTSEPRLSDLSRQMDVSRLAAVGYSFGGGVAAELCRRDKRFRAGVDLDGWTFREVLASGIPKPFLFLIEDDPLWFDNEGPYPDNPDGATRLGTHEFHAGIRQSLALWGGCVGRVMQAKHSDFADAATELRPWPWQPSPRLRPEKIQDTVRRLILAFLDTELNGNQGAFSEASKDVAQYCDLKCFSRGPVMAVNPQPLPKTL